MPLVDPTASPTCTMRRVVVAGTSGSGKTTLAAELGRRLGLPHTEIDGLFHGPNWEPRPTFFAAVGELAAQPTWVTEWQYAEARPILAAAADTMVWLDLSRRVVMWRVVRRTVLRRLHRTELWNGNREQPLRTVFADCDHIVRWAWRTHHRNREAVLDVVELYPELVVVRLSSARAVRSWLDRFA
ncbi:MAG: AAA family ATPase [Thermoleophilia bacterium]|nr:AAA family ATPase [Thermoleophilia bacterium]